MKTNLGYLALLEVEPPTNALKHVIKAENIGFDRIWVEDHFHPWFHTNAQSAFAWSWMGSALQATKHISFCTAVTCPTTRYHPAIVAQAFATMRNMYPGRVSIALGTGEAMNEAPFSGEWPPNPVRQEMLVEALDLMNKLWTSKEPVTFKGKYHHIDSAFLYTKSSDKVPVFFSAMGPVVAKLAGKYGDHLITIGDPNAIKNAVIPNFEKSAKEAGKDPSKMERAIALTYSIDPDYDKALEGLRKFSGSLVPAMFKYKVCSPLEIENNGKLVGKEILETSYIIATEPEQLIKRIESFVDAGITSFAFGNVSPNLDNGVDAFKEIIPYFKE